MYKFLRLGLHFKQKKELIKFIEKIKNKNKYKENEHYSNISHKLIVFLYSENLKIKTSLKNIKKPITKFVEYLRNIDFAKPNKVLQTYRLYGISELTNSFNLQRELLDEEMTECFWYKWEYYAIKCKWWKEKMDKYKYSKNEVSKEIEFLDDDEMEDFYRNNSYDIDELDFDTRNKSTKKLNNNIGLDDLLIDIDSDLKLNLNLSNKFELFKNKY